MLINTAVVKIYRHNKDNGLTTVRLKAVDEASLAEVNKQFGSDFFVADGVLHDPRVGQKVTVEGSSFESPQHGKQMRASAMYPSRLVARSHVQEMLKSSFFRRIPPRLAESMFAKYGDRAISIIEHEGHRLKADFGFSDSELKWLAVDAKYASKIQTTFNFLKNLNMDTMLSVRLIQSYGNRTKSMMIDNVYAIDELKRLDFQVVDHIARSLGMDPLSGRRLNSAFNKVSALVEESGHTVAYVHHMAKKVSQFVQIDPTIIEEIINNKVQKGIMLSVDDEQGRPMIASNNYLKIELEIASQLHRLMSNPLPGKLTPVGDNFPSFLNEQQVQAIKTGVESKVSIVTGGPGVGKTTVTKNIIDGLEAQPEPGLIMLAAPTGKAAQRMSEQTGRDAQTLHSLLEFHPYDGFRYNEHNKLPVDTMVIDEMSMVDLFVFNALLKALPDHARLIVLGDVDQIPSVDVGDILSSMIGSGSIACTRLTKFYRTDEFSTITPNAHLINQGVMPDLYAKSNDFHWIDTKDDAETNRVIRQIVEKNLMQDSGTNPDDIQILSPQYHGDAGVTSLNNAMCDLINPRTPKKFKQTVYGTDFYVGDRVMQMKNNKDLKVSNGEIGKIAFFDLSNKRNKRVKVDFEGRTVDMPLAALGDMTHAYATTIHKSQGSEYPIIIIPISKRHVRSLSRQLVYTGITRGKSQVFLVGDRQALQESLKNSQKTKRYTQLSVLLKMGLSAVKQLQKKYAELNPAMTA